MTTHENGDQTVSENDRYSDEIVLIDATNDLINVRVERVDGRDGAVSVNSRYDRPTTARLLRQIADDYERSAP